MRALLMAAFTLAAVSLGTAAAEDKGKDKAEVADLKAMVGKWSVEKAELGGKDITEHLKTMKFEIAEGGKYTTEIGEEKDAGTFTIDVAKKPKEVTIKSNGGPNKDKIIKAIYKIDGDTLISCYELSEDGKRPEKFESKDDTKTLLITYKRKK